MGTLPLVSAFLIHICLKTIQIISGIQQRVAVVCVWCQACLLPESEGREVAEYTVG